FNHCLLLFLNFYVMQGMGKGIASYVRSPMTKQCIKVLIKAEPMNESALPAGPPLAARCKGRWYRFFRAIAAENGRRKVILL
ncbi:MAG: hypothetical protein UDQ48_08575, partial [Dialister sp.]|uniref:hypothetical protein n=1 Tax=Dialister sp. TaxID=1955814 RepID=UPI002E776690